MRLTCPRCGAQYEIDAAAIPTAGREVGCSACGHMWRASPPTDAFDPAARPVLSRPLSDSVIEILREEAARELKTRAAESAASDGTFPLAAPQESDGRAGRTQEGENGGPARAGLSALAASPAADPASRAGAAHESRPATHMDTHSAVGDASNRPGRAADPSLPLSGAGLAALPAGAGAPAAFPSVPGSAPRTASAICRHPAHDAPPRTRDRRGYDLGFGLAIAAALAAVALYGLAPRLADQGAAGAQLMEWRARVDQGRAVLATQAERLLDQGANLIRGSSGD